MQEAAKPARPAPERFEAALFDLDGVLTDTASLHADCWKRTFDELLARLAAKSGDDPVPFDIATDYRDHVDGKARRDGVRDFLRSRGVRLPEGSPASSAHEDSVHGVARRKDALFSQALKERGVRVYDGSLRWLRYLRAAGLATAVVSASHHCGEVLRAAGIADLFDAQVDGHVAEDALSGVRAGRAGGFGLVVGVARHGNCEALADAGAHLVVGDLEELMP